MISLISAKLEVLLFVAGILVESRHRRGLLQFGSTGSWN